MKPGDIFGIIVRTIGICLLLCALWYLLFGIIEGLSIVAEERPGDARAYLASGIGGLVMAVVLMRGASWFVRFSYPGDEKKRDDPA